jgi:hypothetical protein
MRIVLFLGAGFSAPFGLPTMNEFFRVAEDSPRIDDAQKEFLRELRLEARHANAFLQSSPTNLEDILSLAVMGDRVGLMGKDGVERAPTIKRILQRIYTTTVGSDQYWNQFDVFKSFLDFDLNTQDHELSIVTTNYDLNIESALITNNRSTFPGFQVKPVETGECRVKSSFYDQQGIPVFKLHGSVNWFPDAESPEFFRVEGRVVEVRSRDKFGTLPWPCAKNYPSKEIPVIIPPSFLKPEFPGPLRQIWSGAAKALHDAEVVGFIGYSFPPSDVEMKYFIARCLIDNKTLRKMLLIDKNANDIHARLERDESGFGSHFVELLEPHHKDWTTAKLSLK